MSFNRSHGIAGLAKRMGLALAAIAMGFSPVMSGSAMAQVQSIDPNEAIDADLAPPPYAPSGTAEDTAPSSQLPNDPAVQPVDPLPADQAVQGAVATPDPATAPPGSTYKEDDLIGAAEGVFGQGAEGLAKLIQDVLKDQGEPNGYIVGREASGAFVVGLRYGSGTLYHRVEGQRPVYWTGPSVGFDAGANAGSTFILVYNLHDTQELYQRFPAGEGAAYFVGGFNASYVRSGDIVLIPIRLGVGVRLGANVGYLKFSEKQRWLPF